MFLSLGDQPPSDAFLKEKDLRKAEVKYPLDLFFCPSCSLVQLGYAVDPDKLFRDYVYATGFNEHLRRSFKILVDEAVKKYGLSTGDLAVDIGSNDGTLLQNFLPYNVRILGIDPSSVAAEAQKMGAPTIVDYFNEETANQVIKSHGSAKIITATNVFAHVRDLHSMMRGILSLLDQNGIFISESGYVLDMIEKVEYDNIYHEHLRYYSLTSIKNLFTKYGMEIISAERTIGSSGGSIRVVAAKKGTRKKEASVDELLIEEKWKGVSGIETYRAFAKKVKESRTALLKILGDYHHIGKRIAGIGAPAKGNTLLNYCKISTDLVEYLAERSPLKIGLYSPGMHIPVVDESLFFEDPPDAALLLAWNYADVLIPKFRERGYRSPFIVPNPTPHIVD